MQEVSVEALAQQLQAENETRQLVDVREPQELAIAQLPGFINLPLSESQQWAGDIKNRLDPNKETWVLCHHGMRSAQMCQWLADQGYGNVKNISGGIHAYSIRVDGSVPQY
ncbi:MAG: rhodanese-like domain-containing protein [Cyanobacteria bacterium P01_F01_bin.153]